MPFVTLEEIELEFVIKRVDAELWKRAIDWFPLIDQLPSPLIAGGFIREYFTGGCPSDMDLYFRNEDCFNLSKQIIDESKLYDVAFDTSRAITYKNKEGNNPVQLVKYLYGQPETILSDFDFIMCMGGLDVTTKNLITHTQFIQDITERKLRYNIKTKPFRLSTLKRVVKFVSRGFAIEDADLFAIAERINRMGKKTIEGYKERDGEDAGPWQAY